MDTNQQAVDYLNAADWRAANYLYQTGRGYLTPRQARRYRKKLRTGKRRAEQQSA